jgi:hypothetical protein
MVRWKPSISSDPILGLHLRNRRSRVAGLRRERGDSMNSALRVWKCRHCGCSNTTEVGLDGTSECGTCAKRTQVQPSRIRNGVVLPASYPTKPPTPRRLP